MPKSHKSFLISNNSRIKKWLKLDQLRQKIRESWVKIKTYKKSLSKLKISTIRQLKK